MTIKEFNRKRDKKGRFIKSIPGGWKSKSGEYQKIYLKKNPWMRNLAFARNRSRILGRECTLTASEVKHLWFYYRADTLECPSIDRIDPTKGYIKENCRFIEMRENSRLGSLGRKSSPKQREVARNNISKWALSPERKGEKRGPYKKRT